MWRHLHLNKTKCSINERLWYKKPVLLLQGWVLSVTEKKSDKCKPGFLLYSNENKNCSYLSQSRWTFRLLELPVKIKLTVLRRRKSLLSNNAQGCCIGNSKEKKNQHLWNLQKTRKKLTMFCSPVLQLNNDTRKSAWWLE